MYMWKKKNRIFTVLSDSQPVHVKYCIVGCCIIFLLNKQIIEQFVYLLVFNAEFMVCYWNATKVYWTKQVRDQN